MIKVGNFMYLLLNRILTFFLFRFLQNPHTSLGNLWLILKQMNYCIILRNPKLLYVTDSSKIELVSSLVMSEIESVMYVFCLKQVSDRINCGVYVFSPGIFTAIEGVTTQRKERGH